MSGLGSALTIAALFGIMIQLSLVADRLGKIADRLRALNDEAVLRLLDRTDRL
jgi:hypothetical protein